MDEWRKVLLAKEWSAVSASPCNADGPFTLGGRDASGARSNETGPAQGSQRATGGDTDSWDAAIKASSLIEFGRAVDTAPWSKALSPFEDPLGLPEGAEPDGARDPLLLGSSVSQRSLPDLNAKYKTTKYSSSVFTQSGGVYGNPFGTSFGKPPSTSPAFGIVLPWDHIGQTFMNPWWAHSSLTSDHIMVIGFAFDLLQRYIKFFDAFFALPGVGLSGACTRRFIMPITYSGGSPRGVTIKTRSIGGFGYVFPGFPTMVLDTSYLDAIVNSFFAATSWSQVYCPLSDLANTILHELTHVCLASERTAFLVANFWQASYQNATGYSGGGCCAAMLRSSDPALFPDQAAVVNAISGAGGSFPGFGLNSAGVTVLVC